jgi:hypothetical protein
MSCLKLSKVLRVAHATEDCWVVTFCVTGAEYRLVFSYPDGAVR